MEKSQREREKEQRVGVKKVGRYVTNIQRKTARSGEGESSVRVEGK